MRMAIAAAVFAATIPMSAAHAVTVSGDFDETTNVSISNGDVFRTEVFADASDGANELRFAFTADGPVRVTNTSTINPNGVFEDVTIALEDASGAVLAFISGLNAGDGTPITADFADGAEFFLTASFSDVTTNDSNLDFRVAGAAVPIPAALPMFATALVGFGLLGRRRKTAPRA